MQGEAMRAPQVRASVAGSVSSEVSGEQRTGGVMSPLSITYDDDFRYRTVSDEFHH